MKKLPLLLVFLAWGSLWAEEGTNFRASEILVLPDGFIALRIENTSPQEGTLPDAARGKVFISLAINGIKRAEYLVKALNPAIFLRRGVYIVKTNFRAGQSMKLHVEVNKENAVPEDDLSDNTLDRVLPPLS